MNLQLLEFLAALSQSAHADDYADRFARFQSRAAETSARLRQLGIGPSEKREPNENGGTPTNMIRVHDSMGRIFMSVGEPFFGRLTNRLVVGGDPSPVIIDLDWHPGFLSELRAVGVARSSGTQGRVAIEVNRLILKNGRSIAIKATALDKEGAFGVPAKVVSEKAVAVMGSIAGSFVSGLAAAQQTQSANAFGVSQVVTSPRNAILQGVAQTAADQSKRFLEESTREKPTLIVEPGARITLMLDEDVRQ